MCDWIKFNWVHTVRVTLLEPHTVGMSGGLKLLLFYYFPFSFSLFSCLPLSILYSIYYKIFSNYSDAKKKQQPCGAESKECKSGHIRESWRV